MKLEMHGLARATRLVIGRGTGWILLACAGGIAACAACALWLPMPARVAATVASAGLVSLLMLAYGVFLAGLNQRVAGLGRALWAGRWHLLEDDSAWTAHEAIRQGRDMADRLRRLFCRALGSVDEVYGAARDIAAQTTSLASRAEEIASMLEETAAGMEEFAATVERNTGNCRDASASANRATEAAAAAAASVRDMAAAVAALPQSQAKVAESMSVIEEIAFQTNILAINASFEAVRAGEQGRVFSVIAMQVRQLAQQCAALALDNRAGHAEFVQVAERDLAVAHSVAEQVGAMVERIEQTGELLRHIAAASMEQHLGVGQIKVAVEQMAALTQQNAGAVDETSRHASALCQECDGLSLRLDIFGVSDFQRRDAVRQLVRLGAAHLREAGPEVAIADFAGRDPRFKPQGLGLIVYHTNGELVLHNVRRDMEGSNYLLSDHLPGMTRSGIDAFRRCHRFAMTQGRGWFHYTYVNPASRQVEPKLAYIERVEGTEYIVLCGIHALGTQAAGAAK